MQSILKLRDFRSVQVSSKDILLENLRSVAKIFSKREKSEGMGNSPELDRIGFVTLQVNKNRPSLFISILFSKNSLKVTNFETLFPELQSMCKQDPISDN